MNRLIREGSIESYLDERAVLTGYHSGIRMASSTFDALLKASSGSVTEVSYEVRQAIAQDVILVYIKQLGILDTPREALDIVFAPDRDCSCGVWHHVARHGLLRVAAKLTENIEAGVAQQALDMLKLQDKLGRTPLHIAANNFGTENAATPMFQVTTPIHASRAAVQ